MAGSFVIKLKHAWNAFTSQDDGQIPREWDLSGYGERPYKTTIAIAGDRTILASILTRLSIDVAAIEMRHVRVDAAGQYLSGIDSGLNECLTVAANKDQEARQFRQDIALELFDKGVIAIVPTEANMDPLPTGGYDVRSLRVGQVVQWYTDYVTVRLYDDRPGKGGIRKEITLPKNIVAIVENPLYMVMNAPNSTLQRLSRKLGLLDVVDEQSASGKLDLIIQLPYIVRTELKRNQAETRRKEVEFQLKESQYGIAYIDGQEKVTQLNRPAENNMLGRVEYLVEMLYGQLGLTKDIMNGTASVQAMVAYHNRTIDPVVTAITEAIKRTFLTKTARTQGQSVMYFNDPLRLIPPLELADVVDKLRRNEVVSPNEIRPRIGLPPSDNPKANELGNSNMPQAPPAPKQGLIPLNTANGAQNGT